MTFASGRKLYFYAKSDNDDVNERMEVDFLVAQNGVGRRHNISAIEVKKTKRIACSSLTKFKAKFASELATSYIVHTGVYAKDEDPVRLPVYLLPFVL